jgi:RNA methyltransferase, TrmH family
MISKNEIKYIQSLFQKKTRDKEGMFIAEGVKLVNELLQSDIVVRKIYATEEWITDHKQHPNTIKVQPEELKKITTQSTPNQVLAIVEKKKLATEPILKNKITLALDGIQDPGNFGTIIRIADWFGIDQIIASTDTADLYNSKVIQSTMGSFIRVNVWYKDLATWLSKANIPVYGALLNGTNIYHVNPIKEGLLVIGNESKGVRENILPFIQHVITIPKKGAAESLNAAVAAGIILSHLVENDE